MSKFYNRGSQPGIHVPLGVYLTVWRRTFIVHLQQINFETWKRCLLLQFRNAKFYKKFSKGYMVRERLGTPVL